MSKRAKARILIIDDDRSFHNDMEIAFGKNYHLEGYITFMDAYKKLQNKSHLYDLVLLDLDLQGSGNYESGLSRIPTIKEDFPDMPIIIVTNEKSTDIAVKAMQKGASYFLYKGEYDICNWKESFDKQIQVKILADKSKQLSQENADLKKETKALQEKVQALENDDFPFIGESQKIIKVKRRLQVLGANPNYNVLITGETGTGKEVAARYLHHHSKRDKFEAVHLLSIPKDLVASTLFGHKKGAFTGAKEDRKGFFRQANGGILFLDEIGDVPMEVQTSLLNFLQNKVIRPLGTDKDIILDVQIVAATNKDLDKAIEEGKFRQDLYERFSSHVELPPLREREEDLRLILEFYLEKLKKSGHIEIDVNDLETDVLYKLLHYSWKGNIRQLKRAIEYMDIERKVEGSVKVTLACLPERIRKYSPSISIPNEAIEQVSETTESNNGSTTPLWEINKVQVELRAIETALKTANGNKGEAAEALNKKGRTLKHKMDNLRNRVRALYKECPEAFDKQLFVTLWHPTKGYAKQFARIDKKRK